MRHYDRDKLRGHLELFARGSSPLVPSGHAAAYVVHRYDGKLVLDFGTAYAWVRAENFPGVVAGDFVTVGPGIARWGLTLKGPNA